MLAGINIFATKPLKLHQKEYLSPGGSRSPRLQKKLIFYCPPRSVTRRADCPSDCRPIAPDPDPRLRLISGNPDVRTLNKAVVISRAGWAPDDRPIARLQIYGQHQYRKALLV
jgi:hypothetical protein